MNPVEKRIQELASFNLGQRRRLIRSVRRKVVVPNRRYSWLLFEGLSDLEPIETVVLDVNQLEASDIDRSVNDLLIRPPLVGWEVLNATVKPNPILEKRR